MADHIDDVTTSDIASEPYGTLRAKLKSGDLLFCSGDYLVSKAIRAVTKSPWSHVGIVVRVAAIDRVLLLESVEDVGVRFAPLSKYVDDYDKNGRYNGQLVIARRDGCNDEIVTGVARFGADQLTIPYNKEEIAGILARVTLKIGRVDRLHGFICSELVNDCFRAGNMPFTCDQSEFVSPEDIWVEPSIKSFRIIS